MIQVKADCGDVILSIDGIEPDEIASVEQLYTYATPQSTRPAMRLKIDPQTSQVKTNFEYNGRIVASFTASREVKVEVPFMIVFFAGIDPCRNTAVTFSEPKSFTNEYLINIPIMNS